MDPEIDRIVARVGWGALSVIVAVVASEWLGLDVGGGTLEEKDSLLSGGARWRSK